MYYSAPEKLSSLDHLAPTDLRSYVVAQLNQMYAYMEQAMMRERVRHSSDTKLMLGKVNKDLKDTFHAVRDTFVSLTDQVHHLLEEVETGKKMMRDVQAKFEIATRAAQVRAQYVEELEAVLDGQVPNISQAMKKLTEELTMARHTIEKAKLDAEATEKAVLKEKAALQGTIRSLEERLNSVDNPSADKMKGSVDLPIMQEMAATWTRRLESNSPDAISPPRVDIIGSALAKCDATRGVMRKKSVRPPRVRSSEDGKSAKWKWFCRREELDAITDIKRRAKEAEQRVARQLKLIRQASASLQLLRDIFSELRLNWRFPMDNDSSAKDAQLSSKAPEILDRIVHLFLGSFQNLGKFPEILDKLCEEAKRPVSRLSPEEAIDEPADDQEVSEDMTTTIKPAVETEEDEEALDTDDMFPSEEDLMKPLIPTPKRRPWGAGANLPNLVEEPAFTNRCFSPR
jgi:hypothetical protein